MICRLPPQRPTGCRNSPDNLADTPSPEPQPGQFLFAEPRPVPRLLVTQLLLRDRSIEEDLTPSHEFKAPSAEASPLTGQVRITIEYRIDPARAADFHVLMQESRRSRLRQGALAWELRRDIADAGRYIEQITDESWTEHLCRFDRMTAVDVALREGLGPQVKLMVDLHWKFTAQEAVQLIDQLAPYKPYFVEAPCQPEDIEGQAHVGATARVPLALGEEWRTVFEYRPRFERRAMSIVQPEMGHTGISQFMQIGRMANAFHMKVIPHASIGIGIYQAASLHATAALPNAPMHEYQHSVLDRNLKYVNTSMRCENGAFSLPEGPGLGITPNDSVWEFHRPKARAG